MDNNFSDDLTDRDSFQGLGNSSSNTMDLDVDEESFNENDPDYGVDDDMMNCSNENPADGIDAMPRFDDRIGQSKTGTEKARITIEYCNINPAEIIKEYSVIAANNRLLHIAETCPSQSVVYLMALLTNIKEKTTNISFETEVFNRLTSNSSTPSANDVAWIEKTREVVKNKGAAIRAKVKSAEESNIKEDMQEAYIEQYHFLMKCGEFDNAMKNLNNVVKENVQYTDTVLDGYIKMLETAFFMDAFTKMDSILQQLCKALKDENSSYNESASIASAKRQSEFQKISAKYHVMDGLYKMVRSNFACAAEAFRQADFELVDNPSTLILKDIALYGAICALATLSIDQVKSQFLLNTNFKKALISNTTIYDLVVNYSNSQFHKISPILKSIKNDLYSDKYLCPLVDRLYNLIMQNCVLQYMNPYSQGTISSMAATFEMSPDDMLDLLESLIIAGKINARLDAIHMVYTTGIKKSRDDFVNTSLTAQKLVLARSNASILRAIHIAGNQFIHDDAKSKRYTGQSELGGRPTPSQENSQPSRSSGFAKITNFFNSKKN
uniref:PCI domain-containing protein n=1 Tax=Rhabditophanes sp. KR3021 TaxID=114890 RepID=A0AC35UC59_9BILA